MSGTLRQRIEQLENGIQQPPTEDDIRVTVVIPDNGRGPYGPGEWIVGNGKIIVTPREDDDDSGHANPQNTNTSGG